MRYIIIPLCAQAGDEFLTAFSVKEKEQTGMVIPSDDPEPRGLQQGKDGVCWIYQACFTRTDSLHVIEAVLNRLRADIDPSGEESFTVDLIVDAAHAKQAGSVLALLSQAGQWYRTHVIFLSECDSDYGKDQSDFYIRIRNDAGGVEAESGLGWSWFTLLADENSNGVTGDIIRNQRKRLLPFVIRADHSKDYNHSCYTYAVTSEEIDFDQISEIPRVLALKYACDTIQDHEVFEEFSLLLMNGDVCPADMEAQAKAFKTNLMPHTGIRPITVPDLLIQKHDPQGDFQTRELMNLLLTDNPDYDARRYDQAETEEQLLALPWVTQGADAWESYVLEQTVRHTDIERIRDQLTNDSEWARRIRHEYTNLYYKMDPLSSCTSRISGKKGYNSEAGSDATDDLYRVNEGLNNAVFQAILRLIFFRMHHVLTEIDQIIESRKAAVDSITKSLQKYDTTRNMTPKWCASIMQQLSAISSSVTMNLSAEEEPRRLITEYAESLLDHLKGQLDTKEGYLEMAASENVDALMQKIRNTTTPYPLVNPRFSGGSCIKKDENWFMFERMHQELGNPSVLPTELPIVACVSCYYLYPAADTAPNPEREDLTRIMFGKKINVNIPWANEKKEKARDIQQEHVQWYASGSNKDRSCSPDSLAFQWEYEQADAVNIRYMSIDHKVIEEIRRDKQSFGGKFEIIPPASLPSGMRINIEVLFLRSGHEIGKCSKTFYYETAKQRLEITTEYMDLKGGLFKKIRSRRFRAFNADSERLRGFVCVRNEISGCICKHISWEQDGKDCISEALPEDGAWSVINRPDSPYVYQLD